MAIIHLKKASKTPETETGSAREVVTEMLAAIEKGGEQAVRDYALSLDKWSGPIVMDKAMIAERIRDVPESVKDDIRLAAGQVRRFAEAQKASCRDFSVELSPASSLGRSWCRSTPPAAMCRRGVTPTSRRPTCRSRPPRLRA